MWEQPGGSSAATSTLGRHPAPGSSWAKPRDRRRSQLRGACEAVGTAISSLPGTAPDSRWGASLP